MENHPKEQSEPQSSIRTITSENMTWVDIVPPTQSAMQYLADQFKFESWALEDCLSRRQISKMDVFPGYLFFVFHFPHYDKVTRISRKRQWSAFVGENYLVTVHSGELKSLISLFQDCQGNPETKKDCFSNGPGYLLYRLLDLSTDSYFPVLDKIMSLLEETEANAFNMDVEATIELSILRRDIIAQRMVVLPIRTLTTEIRSKINRYSRVDLTSYFDDLIDHIHRICETLDGCKEVIEVFKDTDFTLNTQRLNRVVRVLNVIATIVLPFLAVSSIYGMNIPLPGGLERGSLTTFFVLLGIMVLFTAIMLILFRRRRWI